MFHRVSVDVRVDKDHFMKSLSFQRASDLYNESIRLQQEGKPAESTRRFGNSFIHLTSKKASHQLPKFRQIVMI